MIDISLVPADQLSHIWDRVGPMLQRSCDHSGQRCSITEIIHDLVDGDQTLWIALDGDQIIGCCTVRIHRYGTDRVSLSYEHLAGADIERWIGEGHIVLSRYAKEYGCDRLEVPHGRLGWWPLLKQIGYRKCAVKYEYDVKE